MSQLATKLLTAFFGRNSQSENEVQLVSYARITSWLWQAWKGYRIQSVFNAVLGLLFVAADLAFVWGTKWAVDIATNQAEEKSLRPAIWLLGSIVLIQLVMGVVSRWIDATIGVKGRNRMQVTVFSHLLNSNWMALKRFHTGDLLNRIEIDVSGVVSFLTGTLPSLLTTLVKFVGAFLFLYFMDSKLAIFVALVIPFFLLASKLYVKKLRFLTRHIRQVDSSIQSIIQESLQHTLVIKTLEKTSTTLHKLLNRQQILRDTIITKTKYSTVSSTLMNAGFAIGYLATFTWGTVSLHRGLITYGALIAFVQLVSQIQGPVRQLTSYVPAFINAFTATERIIELIDIPLEKRTKDVIVASKVGIKLKDIDFAYTEKGRNILHNFSFDFVPGSITAILGETGSGKTTLIRMLLALIKPTKGDIMIYDGNGNTYPITPDTRINFTYVPQGNTLLSGTIRDNLLMSKPDATQEELEAVLRCACADFVFQSPEGLDAKCGEMGAGLSEGQAQRISIARSLLRDAPFLLLDEATSALDNETEKTVLNNIITQYKDRTVIVVTHRHEVLKYCTQTIQVKRKTNS